MGDLKFATREQWLAACAESLVPLFLAHGAEIPAKTRYSCGWPSKSALASKKRRLGECWAGKCSGDGVCEIFISPFLSDPLRVSDVLAHEIVHACVGLECGHKGAFATLARGVGLDGPLTATHAGADLVAALKEIVHNLGDYPHASLDGLTNGQKKQSTRLLKCSCAKCGYNVRITRKWLEVALPQCPVHDIDLDVEGGE
jgi:hypothetical protein